MNSFAFLARTSRRGVFVASGRCTASSAASGGDASPSATGLEENVDATRRLGKQMEALSDSIVVSRDGSNDVQVR